MFANLALNQADNARLLDNIIRAMSMMKSVWCRLRTSLIGRLTPG